MRIASKRVQVLYLSKSEASEFIAMVNEAVAGKEVHTSTRETGPGTAIAVTIDERESDPQRFQPKKPTRNWNDKPSPAKY